MDSYTEKKKSIIIRIILNRNAGSMIETGLIIGFSLLCFVLIVGIILSVLDWSSSALTDFFNFLK